MKITLGNKVGTITKASTLKAYRADCADMNVAAAYAFSLAKKLQQRMIVIVGNSYMQKVCHIAKEQDDVVTYNGGVRQATKVVVVEINGDVFYAEAV